MFLEGILPEREKGPQRRLLLAKISERPYETLRLQAQAQGKPHLLRHA